MNRKFFGLKITSLPFYLLLCSMILIALVSCDLFLNQEHEKGALLVTFSSDMDARTLIPSVSLDVATYKLDGNGPDDETFTVSGLTEESYIRYDLIPGDWVITATAYNASGIPIAETSEPITITIEARKTVVVSLTCIPKAGVGTLSLSLSWPVDSVKSPNVSATLTHASGTVSNIPFGIEAQSGEGVLDGIPNGFHVLSIKLRDNYGTGKTVWGRVEIVQILTDTITNGEWELTSQDISLYAYGGIDLDLTTSIEKPLAVSLSDVITKVFLGTSQTITVLSAEGIDSVQWYLNGDSIVGATSETLTFGADLQPGTYWIDVVVKKGLSFGSTGFRFEVGEMLPALQELSFTPGIEARPGDMSVDAIALSPDETVRYVGHWTGTPNDQIGIYSNVTNELLSSITVGQCIGGTEVSSDGRYVFATAYYGGTVSRFDLLNGNERTDLSIGSWATQMSRFPDKSKLIVHYNSPNNQITTNHSLALVDISGSNFHILDSLDFGRPIADGNIAYSEDGSHMYVAVNSGTTAGPSIYKISVSDFSVVAQSEIAEGAGIMKELSGVVLRGDYLFVTAVTDKKIYKISLDTLAVVDETSCVEIPRFISIHPSLDYLFIAPEEDGNLTIYETTTLSEIASIPVRARCYDIELSAEGSLLYLAHRIDQGGVATVRFTQ